MLENTTKLDIAQLLNGKVVSSFGSTDGKTSISEDTIQLPDGRTVTVREVTDLTKRKEPTDTIATNVTSTNDPVDTYSLTHTYNK